MANNGSHGPCSGSELVFLRHTAMWSLIVRLVMLCRPTRALDCIINTINTTIQYLNFRMYVTKVKRSEAGELNGIFSSVKM